MREIKTDFSYNENPFNEQALLLTQRYLAQGGTEHNPLPKYAEEVFLHIRFTIQYLNNFGLGAV